MKSLFGILLILFFGVGCKSIKKQKEKSTHEALKSVSAFVSDSVFKSSGSSEALRFFEETTQIIEQKFIALDSAGITVLKPVTVTTIHTKSEKTEDRKEDSLNSSRSIESEKEVTETKSRQKDLEKSSEGQEVVEQITEAIFPTWGKVAGSVFAFIVPFLVGWWKKRKSAG